MEWENEAEVYHLYSGGKDSSLAAWILRNMGYRVKTVTVTFGISDDWKLARASARALGFEHEVLRMDRRVLEKAADITVFDGYPNRAIQFVHERALESLASLEGVERISDGTRRDDRVPMLDLPRVRSLEDRFDVAYIRPLLGVGHRTIKELVENLFVVEAGESEGIEKADYEGELRRLLGSRGINPARFFPKNHVQSRVVGWKAGGRDRERDGR